MQLVWFIVLVGVLILVHELGHLVVARLCDVKVLRLSLGFGPRIAAVRVGETEYAVCAVPLGGYVRLLGEHPGDEIAARDRARSLGGRPTWQRVAIVLAGPAANLVFPSLIYFRLHVAERTAVASVIGTVFEGQPADGVLMPGDRIVAIDGESVRYWEDVNRIVAAAPGRDLAITVERQGEDKPLTKVVTPRAKVRRDLIGDPQITGQLGLSPRARLAQIGVRDDAEYAELGGNPAARAGLRTFDVITSVQGRPVETYKDLEVALARSHGEATLVTYLRPHADNAAGFLPLAWLEPGTAQVFPARVAAGKGHPAHYEAGIRPGSLFVHHVEPGSPADRAGIHPGDEIMAVDGVAPRHFEVLMQALEEHPERSYQIDWKTPAGEPHGAAVRLDPHPEIDAHDEAAVAAGAWVFGAEPARATRAVREVPVEARIPRAARRAIETTGLATAAMARIFGRLLTLRLSPTAIGGPIMIYHLTGSAVAHGTDRLWAVLALLSLNLGLLNLLPIPILDGGYLVLLAIESLRRRPLPARVREQAFYGGVVVLAALTMLAARNDIVRYWLR